MQVRDGLGERKLKILHAIIQNYLETGEPVGSRTISKYTDLNLSSATIRNEMADLEELGYILQPHTSAGRIPSDKGYRLYVDMLMEEKEQELNEMQEQMLDKADKMDQLLKQAARVLAANTNYATLVSTPTNSANKLKFIQLSQVDDEQIIAVIVLGGNVIKNKIINVGEPLGNENLLKLNMLLNTTLNGMSIEYELVLAQSEDCLVVPAQAVQYTEKLQKMPFATGSRARGIFYPFLKGCHSSHPGFEHSEHHKKDNQCKQHPYDDIQGAQAERKAVIQPLFPSLKLRLRLWVAGIFGLRDLLFLFAVQVAHFFAKYLRRSSATATMMTRPCTIKV